MSHLAWRYDPIEDKPALASLDLSPNSEGSEVYCFLNLYSFAFNAFKMNRSMFKVTLAGSLMSGNCRLR